MSPQASTTDTEGFIDHDQVLEQIQDRVLWLSMNMVHHANNVRYSPDGKVGGHQASSASVATIMTSLYFDFMRAGDRISVKPHAGACLSRDSVPAGQSRRIVSAHAAPVPWPPAYPSRTKDPDDVTSLPARSDLGRSPPISPRSWTSTTRRTCSPTRD